MILYLLLNEEKMNILLFSYRVYILKGPYDDPLIFLEFKKLKFNLKMKKKKFLIQIFYFLRVFNNKIIIIILTYI